MSDNNMKKTRYSPRIKRAWYVYDIETFKYIVCFSEYYIHIFFVHNEITCFVYFCSFDTIDFKTEVVLG